MNIKLDNVVVGVHLHLLPPFNNSSQYFCRSERVDSIKGQEMVITLKEMGCGCNTAVEHTPHDLKVVGLNPTGC